MFFLGNKVCSVFKSNNYFWGACPHLWDLNGGCVPFNCLLSLHLTCFSSLRPLPTGDSSLAPSSLLLRVEVQQAGDHAVSSFWTSGKGSDQGRPSLPWDLQGWLFLVPAVPQPSPVTGILCQCTNLFGDKIR